MNSRIRWETAQVVPVGPNTKFTGTEGAAPEEWVESGDGVQITVDVGPYMGTLIIPFAGKGDTRCLMDDIAKELGISPVEKLKEVTEKINSWFETTKKVKS